MYWPWKRPYRDVVRRQLSLFVDDHAELIRTARMALDEYHRSSDAELAQISYADHDDFSEDVEIALRNMCDAYASRLDSATARRYRREFSRQARRAFRDLIPELNLLGTLNSDD